MIIGAHSVGIRYERATVMTLHVPQDNSELDPRFTNPTNPGADDESETGLTTDDGDGLAEDLEQLSGVNPDQTAYFDVTAVDGLEGITSTDVYQGETTDTQERVEAAEQFDMLIETDLREGETDDVMEAIQEGFTYVPPIDPPVTPITDDPEGAEVATGFGLTAEDDLATDDLDTIGIAEDDLTARVRRVLRDDSLTQHLARRLRIGEENGVVLVRGEVDDLTDSDNLIAVIGDVPGVTEVIDETTVRGL
jgi:hypothetical protein